MAIFLSCYDKQVLVMKPAQRFERDGEVVSQPGHRIEFKNGRFETDNQEEIEFLKNHPEFDVTIFEYTPSEWDRYTCLDRLAARWNQRG